MTISACILLAPRWSLWRTLGDKPSGECRTFCSTVRGPIGESLNMRGIISTDGKIEVEIDVGQEAAEIYRRFAKEDEVSIRDTVHSALTASHPNSRAATIDQLADAIAIGIQRALRRKQEEP